jgi:hypothetical protein
MGVKVLKCGSKISFILNQLYIMEEEERTLLTAGGIAV